MNDAHKEPGSELHIAELPLEMGFFTVGCTVKVHLKNRGNPTPFGSVRHACAAHMECGLKGAARSGKDTHSQLAEEGRQNIRNKSKFN